MVCPRRREQRFLPSSFDARTGVHGAAGRVDLGADARRRRLAGPGGRRRARRRAGRPLAQEAILSAGAALFAEKGFSGVSVDDIGAAVGIAGPSVYNHFASKTDILVAAMFRGNERLWMDFNRAVADARDASETLRRVVLSYRTFAFANPDLVEILITEAAHLPASDSHSARPRSAPTSTNGCTWRDNRTRAGQSPRPASGCRRPRS